MMNLYLANETPSQNVIDLRAVTYDVLIMPETEFQQALFYAGMKGAFSVAIVALLILGFAVLVRECRTFNEGMRS